MITVTSQDFRKKMADLLKEVDAGKTVSFTYGKKKRRYKIVSEESPKKPKLTLVEYARKFMKANQGNLDLRNTKYMANQDLSNYYKEIYHEELNKKYGI